MGQRQQDESTRPQQWSLTKRYGAEVPEEESGRRSGQILSANDRQQPFQELYECL